MMQTWLAIVGICDDGLEGLSPVARSLLDGAAVVVGGTRHLAMLPAGDRREQLPWSRPLTDTLAQIEQRRGQAVCVLASGDPLWYGIGATLCRRLAPSEFTIVPAPSAFSLACARLGWPLAEVETLSLCGREPTRLNAVLYPGARLLVLSADRSTPNRVAQLLVQAGFGASHLTVLEHLGGPRERIFHGEAATWVAAPGADLNTIAIACQPSPGAGPGYAPRLPGLPDQAYRHDGQLTKREVRAVTLSTLAPRPGELLWDVGAGCGSIGIEWLRSDRRCRAIALEQHPERLQLIAHNAAALGTPQLHLVPGPAPATLAGLPTPAAIFIGGGLTTPALVDTCWQALGPGGRLVANAVTVESEAVLLQHQSQIGGQLTRIAIQRAEPLGKFLSWKAMAPVTQWAVVKP